MQHTLRSYLQPPFRPFQNQVQIGYARQELPNMSFSVFCRLASRSAIATKWCHNLRLFQLTEGSVTCIKWCLYLGLFASWVLIIHPSVWIIQVLNIYDYACEYLIVQWTWLPCNSQLLHGSTRCFEELNGLQGFENIWKYQAVHKLSNVRVVCYVVSLTTPVWKDVSSWES